VTSNTSQPQLLSQPTVESAAAKQKEKEREIRKQQHEADRRKHEERKKLEQKKAGSTRSSSHVSSAPKSVAGTQNSTPAAPEQPNALKQRSDFLCRIKFRTSLPDIPFDPKLREYPFDPMRFVQYTTTSLERDHKHAIHPEPDLGIPIDLIDQDIYKQPNNPADRVLAPEDQELLQESSTSLAQKPAKRRIEEIRSNVSWLRKTEYISMDDSSSRRGSGRVSEGVRIKEELMVSLGIEQQIEQIEETFARAKEPPVHATNPDLTPIEILPIFPNFDLWPNIYTQVSFDGDPTDDVVKNGGTDADIDREELVSYSLLKGNIDTANPDSKYLAYMAPNANERKRMKRADGTVLSQDDLDSRDEVGYEWLREYDYREDDRVRTDTYFLILREGDGAYYMDIKDKLVLSKRKSRGKGGESMQNKYSNITVRKRALNNEEMRVRRERVKMLDEPVPREDDQLFDDDDDEDEPRDEKDADSDTDYSKSRALAIVEERSSSSSRVVEERSSSRPKAAPAVDYDDEDD